MTIDTAMGSEELAELRARVEMGWYIPPDTALVLIDALEEARADLAAMSAAFRDLSAIEGKAAI